MKDSKTKSTYIPLASLVNTDVQNSGNKKLYVETYGCQMNFADTEIVNGVMSSHGYITTENIEESNVILVNTCSIREHAEAKVLQRLTELKKYKVQNLQHIL